MKDLPYYQVSYRKWFWKGKPENKMVIYQCADIFFCPGKYFGWHPRLR
jgi:hypothetical protein